MSAALIDYDDITEMEETIAELVIPHLENAFVEGLRAGSALPQTAEVDLAVDQLDALIANADDAIQRIETCLQQLNTKRRGADRWESWANMPIELGNAGSTLVELRSALRAVRQAVV